MLEGAVKYTAGHKRADGDDAAVADGELFLATTHIPERDVVVRAGELRCEVSEHVVYCGYFLCHIFSLVSWR